MHKWYFEIDGKYYTCNIETGFVIRYNTCIHLDNGKTVEENHKELFRNIVEFKLYDVKTSTKDEYVSFIEKKKTRML